LAKIKICGLSRREDIEAVNEVSPDYIGFVFAKSVRQVTEETADILKELLSPGICSVGVFVNDELDRIKSIAEQGIIDMVQLHGDETYEYLQQLRQYINLPILKALRVSGREDLINANQLPCDYLLLDTYHKGQFGGTGVSFDWSCIPRLHKPFFLAGGINSHNVIDAITKLQPYCVDVSSAVESEGYKDPAKIIELVKKVRSVSEG
jgi:phosphoribosylanthranilate isomerase